MLYIDPKIRQFLDNLAAQGGPPLQERTPAEARKFLSDAQAIQIPLEPAEIEDRTIQAGPTGQVRLRIVRPQGASGTLPVIMYIHGGGWIMGGPDTHDRLVRELANGIQATLVFVDYDRSPEAAYPTAIEQAYAATVWTAEHAADLNVDASRMAVVGDSVGGNMATVLTMLARDRRGPTLRYQVLFYPVTDANFDTPSYREFATGTNLTRDAMIWFWNAYAPEGVDRSQPTVSPLRASLDQLKGLPPTLLITDENDVLRDEGEAYAHKLAEAGVPVTGVRYLDTIHDFVMLNGIAETPETRGAIAQACDTLRRVLHEARPGGVTFVQEQGTRAQPKR